MYQIYTQRWEEGRLIISRFTKSYETREEAEADLRKKPHNKNIVYQIKENVNGA